MTPYVKDVIRECFDLGPLHNPANLIGIEAVEAAMPGKPNVAVFDTSFGMGMEPKAYRYAIPDKYYDQYGVRRRSTACMVFQVRLNHSSCQEKTQPPAQPASRMSS